MRQPDVTQTRAKGFAATLAVVAATGACAVASTLSPSVHADPPAPAPPTISAAAAPVPAPPDSDASPADPNAPPPPPPPEPGRVTNDAAGMSFVVPEGWTNADASRLAYGWALLTKTPPSGSTTAPTDTSIVLGRLDLKLFAGAEPDNTKAAIRLASDMGEFFMPFQGIRINQQVIPLDAAGIPGAASYHEVKFNDTSKPNGQIWAAALGTVTPRVGRQPAQNDRWFVVWLGDANHPVDKAAAQALAESIRPWTRPRHRLPRRRHLTRTAHHRPIRTRRPHHRGWPRWVCRFRCRMHRRE